MLGTLISLVLLAGPAVAAPQVLVVGPGEPFAQIQDAIDAAQDGDLVLVRAGTYAGFAVDGKSLVVHADGPVTVTATTLESCIEVSNVPAGSRVVVRGFLAEKPYLETFVPSGFSNVRATGNAGTVWIEDVVATSFKDAGGFEILDSGEVILVRCSTSGDGSSPFELQKWNGGDGLTASASTIYLFDSHLAGKGGSYGGYGGGEGASLDGGVLFAASTTFEGGDGGGADLPWCLTNGGVGLEITNPPTEGHHAVDCTFLGGANGWGTGLGIFCGDAPAVVGSGLVELPADGLMTAVTSAVWEGGTLHLDLSGPPGVLAFLGVSEHPSALFVAPLSGALVLEGPYAVVFLGALDPLTGTLGFDIAVPGLPPGVLFGQFYGQTAYVDSSGAIVLGAPSAVTLLDGSL